MARLFPAMQAEEIDNPGERKVARVLAGELPDRVEIIHSFNWLGRDRKGTLQEGECDFVVLDADSGLLFVEVKGGALVFDGQAWMREVDGGRRALGKDPFAQAQRGMHGIMELVKRQFPDAGDGLPFTYGFAVAFPDCRLEGRLPPSVRPELILDAARLRDVPDAVTRIFASFRRPGHRRLESAEMESVRASLFPRYRLVPVLWRRIEDQEERLQRMTDDQQEILEVLAGQPVAAIRGIAGSGKTLLATAKAQAMARDGRHTLLLCYNRPLRDWLRDAAPESFGERLAIETYHSLTYRLCREAGVPFWESDRKIPPEFWTDTAPEALVRACDRLDAGRRFDAVVVDEGQDFSGLWWTSLDSVFRDPARKACFYAFYDPNQNLYVDAPALPGEFGRPLVLPANCRNTVRIAEHCAGLAGIEHRSRNGAPLGDAPEMLQVRTLADAFREAGRHVRRLCMPKEGGLRASQVAVLAPGVTKKAWPRDFGTVPLVTDIGPWRRGEGVLMASWSRFKGLEADAVIIIEGPETGDPKEAVHRYVARSRAKHRLTVIAATES